MVRSQTAPRRAPGAAAARSWGAQHRRHRSGPDSFEALFVAEPFAAELSDVELAPYVTAWRTILTRMLTTGPSQIAWPSLRAARLERYIGVACRPESERASHYAHASLSDPYGGFVWFDESRASTPLPAVTSTGEDETYPFGL
ncbi:erythromycin esterase family protein [Caulobacter sp. KR2-114]|uniref:erythromycin esterase family protein n=1 Tax=Caulobacter sp. KR2-114 TaxID=3400912 RepID=UPI003C105EA4